MASFKTTLKRALLNYHTIFPNPADVCVHLFCVIGNGYEWKDGQLVDKWDPHGRKKKPDYGDPSEKWPDHLEDYLRKDITYQLSEKARKVQQQFVIDNIDDIVKGSPVAEYFGHRRGYYLIKEICLDYARAFHFPDDIKPDWAEALYKFCYFWLQALNEEYRVGSKGDVSHWPTDITEAYEEIKKVRARLYSILHNGEPYEVHAARVRETTKVLLDKLDKKE